ncbi:MAG: hypothetical protein ANABAC_3182 [Anaerolineae bacterium]|nr:MAG: hypothetical protein ANABAC_3182 [Anaerolineae bacterium]
MAIERMSPALWEIIACFDHVFAIFLLIFDKNCCKISFNQPF